MPTGARLSTIGLRLSLMMFLQFFVWGAWYVTVGNFIGSVGWGGDVVGWAYSVGPIAGIISPFFLGMVADRFFATQRVLGSLHILGGILMLCVPFTARGDSPPSPAFIALLMAHMLCYMPTLGLVNTLSFHNMKDQAKEFPLIRVFGTIGWIAAGIFVSRILGADRSDVQFQVAGGAAILLGLYCYSLPNTPPPAAGKAFSVRDALGLDALVLFKNPSFAIFIVSSFLICIPLAAYYSYAPIYADAVGFAEPGFTMSFGQMSEVLFMIVMPLCFARLGVKWMLLVGMLAWVVRYGLFSVGWTDKVHWMVLVGIILHGICYDFFFVTGQIYVDKRAPKEIRGQAQGLLVLMTLGLGLWIGANQVGPRLLARYTPPEAAQLEAQIQQIGGQVFELEKKLAAATEAEGSPLRAQIDKLSSERGALSHQKNMLSDWKSFWFVPCVMAGVVMALFALFFRDNAQDGAQGK